MKDYETRGYEDQNEPETVAWLLVLPEHISPSPCSQDSSYSLQ